MISGNTTDPDGGGVERSGTVALNGSSGIDANFARGAGGGVAFGYITLNDTSSISGNTAHGQGGGVWVLGTGTLTMNDYSTIGGNTVLFLDRAEPGHGGGVANGGDVFLHDSSTITGNSAASAGGGLAGAGTSSIYICAPAAGANVYRNTPDDCSIESP